MIISFFIKRGNREEPLFPVVALPRATIHREIDQLKTGYDYVVIDGPPQDVVMVDEIKAMLEERWPVPGQ